MAETIEETQVLVAALNAAIEARVVGLAARPAPNPAAVRALNDAVTDAQTDLDDHITAAMTTARAQEAAIGAPIRELCSGRIPQQASFLPGGGRIDPEAVFGPYTGGGNGFPPEYYQCPPNVPLFSTQPCLTGGRGLNQNGKRSRDPASEQGIAVTAHIPTASRLATFRGSSKLYFVGISYGPATKSGIVSIITSGQMPMVHLYGNDDFYKLLGRNTWWERAKGAYGSRGNLVIAVPSLVDDTILATGKQRGDNLGTTDIFEDGRLSIVVQSADMSDCSILVG